MKSQQMTDEELPAPAQVAYRLDANEYNGVTRVQLMVEFAPGGEGRQR